MLFAALSDKTRNLFLLFLARGRQEMVFSRFQGTGKVEGTPVFMKYLIMKVQLYHYRRVGKFICKIELSWFIWPGSSLCLCMDFPEDSVQVPSLRMHFSRPHVRSAVILGYGNYVLRSVCLFVKGKNNQVLLESIHIRSGKCPGTVLSAYVPSHPPVCTFL